MRVLFVTLAALACLGQAAHTASSEPEPIIKPYSVGGCLMHLDGDEPVMDECDSFDRMFRTYDEARAYARTISRDHPNHHDNSWHGHGPEPWGWRSTFSIMRIVSYDIEPGAIAVGVPLTENDLVEDWENGHIDMRIAPPSRRCGSPQVVRWHVMNRICRD